MTIPYRSDIPPHDYTRWVQTGHSSWSSTCKRCGGVFGASDPWWAIRPDSLMRCKAGHE